MFVHHYCVRNNERDRAYNKNTNPVRRRDLNAPRVINHYFTTKYCTDSATKSLVTVARISCFIDPSADTTPFAGYNNYTDSVNIRVTTSRTCMCTFRRVFAISNLLSNRVLKKIIIKDDSYRFSFPKHTCLEIYRYI